MKLFFWTLIGGSALCALFSDYLNEGGGIILLGCTFFLICKAHDRMLKGGRQ